MNTDLESLLQSAAVTVFSTMLNFKPQFVNAEGEFFNGEEHVAGAVGLTGAFDGMIYIYSSASFARRMACGVLSMTDAELGGNEMVNDVMGELTNMVAGHIKSKMDNAGTSCVMTVPSVVRGKDFRIVPVSGGVRKSIYLRCDGGMVLLDALLKQTK